MDIFFQNWQPEGLLYSNRRKFLATYTQLQFEAGIT